MLGYFNEVLHQSEKRGLFPHPSSLIDTFKEVVANCGLRDLGFVGYDFTWEKWRGTLCWVKERLDRALVNEAWLDKSNESRLLHLATTTSDHLPILLEPDKFVSKSCLRKFQYENA